jgi:hypothetical protein
VTPSNNPRSIDQRSEKALRTSDAHDFEIYIRVSNIGEKQWSVNGTMVMTGAPR